MVLVSWAGVWLGGVSGRLAGCGVHVHTWRRHACTSSCNLAGACKPPGDAIWPSHGVVYQPLLPAIYPLQESEGEEAEQSRVELPAEAGARPGARQSRVRLYEVRPHALGLAQSCPHA